MGGESAPLWSNRSWLYVPENTDAQACTPPGADWKENSFIGPQFTLWRLGFFAARCLCLYPQHNKARSEGSTSCSSTNFCELLAGFYPCWKRGPNLLLIVGAVSRIFLKAGGPFLVLCFWDFTCPGLYELQKGQLSWWHVSTFVELRFKALNSLLDCPLPSHSTLRLLSSTGAGFWGHATARHLSVKGHGPRGPCGLCLQSCELLAIWELWFLSGGWEDEFSFC